MSISIPPQHHAPPRPARTHGRLWMLGIAWVALLAALVAIVSQGPEPLDAIRPLRRWAGLLYGQWIVFTFMLAQWGIGTLLKPMLRLPAPRAHALPLAILQFVLGSFVSSAYLLILVALRVPGPIVIWSYTALAAGALLVALWRWIDCAARCPLPVRRRSWAPAGWLMLLAAVWILPLIVQAVLPNHDWDGAAYHLPLARIIYTTDFWSIDPIFWWYALPSGEHLFYGLFVAWGATEAIIPFNLALGVLSVVLVYFTARLIAGRRAGALAALIYLSQGLVWEVAITPRTDTTTTFYVAAALHALVSWLRHRRQGGWLIYFGVALGVALGLRQTSFIPVGCAGLVALALLITRFRSLRRPVWVAAGLGMVLVVIPSSLWNIRTALATRDPFYPAWRGEVSFAEDGRIMGMRELQRFVYRNAPTRDELLASVAGTPFEQAARASATITPPAPNLLAFWDALTAPRRHERKPLHALNVLLLPALLVLLARRDRATVALLLIAVASWGIMGTRTFNARYMLPIVPALAVLAGMTLAHRRAAWVGMAAMTLLVIWRAPQIARHTDTIRVFIEPLLWRYPGLVENMTVQGTGDAPELMKDVIARLVRWGGIIALVMLAAMALLTANRRRRMGAAPPIVLLSFVVAVLLAAATALLEYHKTATEVRSLPYLLARESQLEFLTHVGYNRTASVPRLIRAMLRMERDRQMSFDGKILQIAATPAGQLPMPYIPDGSFTGRRWGAELMNAGSLDEYARQLRERQVRYVLINLGTIVWGGYSSPPARNEVMLNLQTMAEFWRRYAVAEPLYDSEDLLLLEVRP